MEHSCECGKSEKHVREHNRKVRGLYPFKYVDSKFLEMVFRRSLAPDSDVQWAMRVRQDVEAAQTALNDMLKGEKGTVRKDRHSLAEIFRDVAKVLETKSIEHTRFSKDVEPTE